MPPLEEMDLNDKAVFWRRLRDDNYGKPIVDSPVEIDCRWEFMPHDVREKEGAITTYTGSVTSAQELEIGSLIWFGTLAEWFGTGSAGEADVKERSQVVKGKKTPDLDGRFYQWTYKLQRYRDTTTK